MERTDFVLMKNFENRTDYGSLQSERPLRVEIRLSRKIEVYVLDVEINDEGLSVPQRATYLEPSIQQAPELRR
jgi:hypothetical protein